MSTSLDDFVMGKLLAEGQDVIDSHRRRVNAQMATKVFLFRPDVLLTVFFTATLFAEGIVAMIYSQSLSMGRDIIIEGALLLGAIVFNGYITLREARLTLSEMASRLQSLLDNIRETGVHLEESFKMPTNIPSVTVVRVIRSGITCCCPSSLLIEDDVVQLTIGDRSPGLCHFADDPAVVLQRGEMLRAHHFQSSQANESMKKTDHFFKFVMDETPLRRIFSSALELKRPETIISHGLALLFEVLTTRIIWVVFGVCFLVNLARFISAAVTGSGSIVSLALYLCNAQFYAVFPFLPLSLPALCLIARSYGNAQIVCLLDVLQSSTKEFKDQANIDEFDAAPPPTKDVTTDWFSVWKIFLDQMINNDSTFLARTTGLVESLASTTVICSIDREGSLSLPYPSADSFFLIGPNGEPIILKMKEDPAAPCGVGFEEKLWPRHLSSLKPLGLNLLLNTRCGATSVHSKSLTHRKSNVYSMDGRAKPAINTCLCRVGRAIGFDDTILEQFLPLELLEVQHPSLLLPNEQDTPDYHLEVPRVTAQSFIDTATGESHLFCEGSMEMLINFCGDYWNGEGVVPLDALAYKRIGEFYETAITSDFQVVGFSYRPLLDTVPTPVEDYGHSMKQVDFEIPDVDAGEIQDNVTAFSHGLRPRRGVDRMQHFCAIDYLDPNVTRDSIPPSGTDILGGQTFLSMASLYYQPKPNVIDFIEDLSLAGIRYVYFSSAPERESKAYAERLGLEIDWNSCILLSSSSRGCEGYLDLHDVRAKLPRGVENIREHLITVDDVPLHVSLFAECTPPSIIEMVRIFQENGEVVCCIGSSLNDFNVECFAIADIGVAVDPFTALKARANQTTRPLGSLLLSSGLATSPCAVRLHFDTSLYSLAQIIKEARTLAENARQGFSFYVGCQLSLSATVIISYFFALPQIITGYQLMWLLWVVLPLQTLPFLFSPHDPDVMTTMPVKNIGVLKQKWKIFYFYCLRFSFPVFGMLALFTMVLSHLLVGSESVSVFGSLKDWRQSTANQSFALLTAQNMTLLLFELLIVVMSAMMLSRTRSVFQKPPWLNTMWVVLSIVTICLQLAFALTSLRQDLSNLTELPWYIYFGSVLFVCGTTIIQELVNRRDRAELLRFQKFSKLQFNTKLGMHSPI